MSFFKTIRKVILVDICNQSYKLYALKTADLISFSKLNRAIELEITEANLKELVSVIREHFVEDKPTIDELLELDVATIRNLSQELVLASTPLEYADREAK